MAGPTRVSVVVAVIGALSAVVVAGITTYGTIAVTRPEARKVKEDLQEIAPEVARARAQLESLSELERIANLPIGTIVSSMLPPDAFAKEVGDTTDFDPKVSRWVLADGKSQIYGSAYAGALKVLTPPDLRGVFLRGMNYNGGKDPQQGRAAESYQEDALQQHGHETNALSYQYEEYWGESTKYVGYAWKPDVVRAVDASVTNVTGRRVADETRPKNVAVYFYIKIN